MMASIGLQKPSTTPRTVHRTSSHSVAIEDRIAELGDGRAKVPGGYGEVYRLRRGVTRASGSETRNRTGMKRKRMPKVDTSKYKTTRTTNEGGRYGVGEGGERWM